MRDIESKDLMHIGFLKKERYTGSSEGMRYLLEKAMRTEADEEEHTCLRAVCWPEPYCYDATADELKTEAWFSFDEDGVEAARKWLNAQKPRFG